jgi:hypothetical protein
MLDSEIGSQRDFAISTREEFFNMILMSIIRPPGEIDYLMGQGEFFFPHAPEGLINDAEMGNLVFRVKPEFYGKTFDYAFSIYLTGEKLKIGLLLSGGLDQAPLLDWNREISELWWGEPPEKLDRAEITLYEWMFQVPDLYKSWALQEQFILGLRHVHFRVLRIIHDYCKDKYGI